MFFKKMIKLVENNPEPDCISFRVDLNITFDFFDAHPFPVFNFSGFDFRFLQQ